MDVKLILTSDGSHSLLNTALDETYHSRHGAVQESMHVFIKHGLETWAAKNPGKTVNIFEVGFGTGLNGLLTALTGLPVNYTAIEAFPLGEPVYSVLNYSPHELLQQLHRAPWNEWTEITDNFRLKKIESELEKTTLTDHYDMIYFDAFAPSKQPSMWELPVLTKVCGTLPAGGIFVTYCAKGQLKRDLRSLGFEVETLVGPPGKKEMVRGTKK
ncbi:MAG TPA: tRNA (5-methylaminomethyl-2-thiouridine)(34)-methyltransferase MnmD [Cyclobacteriaceae bacterium]|nr:tRNA (5-methylaminomethyl-2-thiouridine)(34)-methyltransferase MnmD [Cyclobacteriaceae bacterium]